MLYRIMLFFILSCYEKRERFHGSVSQKTTLYKLTIINPVAGYILRSLIKTVYYHTFVIFHVNGSKFKRLFKSHDISNHSIVLLSLPSLSSHKIEGAEPATMIHNLCQITRDFQIFLLTIWCHLMRNFCGFLKLKVLLDVIQKTVKIFN